MKNIFVALLIIIGLNANAQVKTKNLPSMRNGTTLCYIIMDSAGVKTCKMRLDSFLLSYNLPTDSAPLTYPSIPRVTTGGQFTNSRISEAHRQVYIGNGAKINAANNYIGDSTHLTLGNKYQPVDSTIATTLIQSGQNNTLQPLVFNLQGDSAIFDSTGTISAAKFIRGWVTSHSASGTTITLPSVGSVLTALTGSAKPQMFFDIVVNNYGGANIVTISLPTGYTALNTITGENTLTVAQQYLGIFRVTIVSPNKAFIGRIQ